MEVLEKADSKVKQHPKRVRSTFSQLDSHTLKCRNTYLPLGSRTIIMGVLNLTPDSFYDGGKFTNIDAALKHVERVISEGADIIDVGGESTKPGSLSITLEEECERVIPVISEINKNFDIIISIDTTKSAVALEALKEGASIVNDISGLTFDEKIADAASEYKAGLVVSHTSARPEVMQEHTEYESLLEDIIDSLSLSVKKALDRGVESESIIIDPGFGFGKTAEQNLLILKNLHKICELGKPVLIGTSNKSFIGKVLNAEVNERIEGTAATVAIGIANGASIIRVHEIEHMKKIAVMADAVMNIN